MVKKYSIIAALTLMLTSCIDDLKVFNNTYRDNFEALWHIVDTRYCYFEEKNVDWDSVYRVFNARLKTDTVNELRFFDSMSEMLSILRDGHVNLYSDFDRSRYWKWFTDYPANFSSALIFGERYLGTNFRVVNGLRYRRIANGTVGYIYYNSFSDSFTDQNIRHIFNYFSQCKGLIIDVRNNGGGSAELSNKLASYFFQTDVVSLYMRHKVGPGHNQFSELVPIPTNANTNGIQWLKPVVILSNRSSYSATNMFICRMKDAPNATVVGDWSGGGGGLPLSSELPNGWMVRFSASPLFNAAFQSIEGGIEPDHLVALNSNDALKGIDTIIDFAVNLIVNTKSE